MISTGTTGVRRWTPGAGFRCIGLPPNNNVTLHEESERMTRRRWFSIAGFFIIALAAFYVMGEAAEAARLGGGRSFGSRPSYQRSAPAPSTSPTSPQMRPGQTSPQMPGAASGMGRWGGMLGGLVAGSLIGSLLFGGGMHGAGGIGLLDIALIGGGLFLLMRVLRARRMATAGASAGESMSFDRGPAQSWGHSGYDPAADPAPASTAQPSIPPGFDSDEFLKGAKAIYTRLQSSWDQRDLDDIRQFTAPDVFEEIQRQFQEDPTPGKTELLLINPKILEVRELDGQIVASVLYDVMMREASTEMGRQVREIWHFSRAVDNPKGFWVLEGIQQVEG
jgi:predicted lipid-binding transport protein (Tim44 family)